MRYADGSVVALGDTVIVPVPGGTANARIVMLGQTYEHLNISEDFLAWVKTEKILQEGAVVIEWVGPNPFAHNDQRYAPVGNYMFTALDACIKRAP
jgi:hypothetical protein